MRKRLLFALVAMCVAVSGFALEQGEFVYTPQGRFQITGANLNANNAFQDMTGWTVVSASSEKTLADQFNINANGYAEGFNSVASLDATAGEGMYYKFEPTDASAAYVVSYKLKGATAVSVRVSTLAVSTNLVKIEGNSDNVYGGENDVLLSNTAEELTEEWQTFNYAIVGDGTARTYFISFTGIETSIEIADLQIAPALQFANLRQRDAMLEKLNAYKNCYEWPEGLMEEFAVNEIITNLEAIGDGNGQAELDEQLATAQEVLDEFLKANMDDYLAGNTANYLGLRDGNNLNKQNQIGDWIGVPAGRAHWSSNSYPDMGHYQGGNSWNYGNPTTPMGVYMQKTLDPGSYVFSISGSAAIREPAKQSWYIDEGLNVGVAYAYIKKVLPEGVEASAADTIVCVEKELDAVDLTTSLLTAKITESGTYEIGYMVYCKEAYQSLLRGSVVYVANASMWGKNENVYNQKQLGYEADVREQITTGRNNLTTADEYLANEDLFWGKAALAAVVQEVEPKIVAYEAMTQDDIIATYDNYIADNGEDSYKKSTSDPAGIMVYEVYQEATKLIIDANRKFQAVNDTLNSIQVAIDAAEATMVLRLYSTATGTADLQVAIDKAKGILADMKATDYSEENAATIKAANAELAEAVEAFKASVPASAIATIVDIDFEKDAVLNEDTQTYSIPGEVGAMDFTHFSKVNPEGEDSPYQQGFWADAQQKWKGYLRVGNGEGVVNFDPAENGSMGSNIITVSCDFYIQGLSGRFIGFYLKDADDNNISGFYRNYYDGTSGYDPFDADVTKIWAKSGGSYNDASPADAEEPTSTVIEKTHFEVIMDYGTQKMYCNISSPNGSTTSQEVAFEGIPAKFVLTCNYDQKFATRRAWFDNLKIERIAAGETEQFVDGVAEINAAANVKAPTKVLKNGRIVINGKYAVNGMLVK